MSEQRREFKRAPTRKDIELIRSRVREELGTKDLKPWQEACKSFAPFNYRMTTRKEWFQTNEHKVATARKIIKFVDKMAKSLRKHTDLQKVKMSGIREEVINGIREVQRKQGIDKNLLNSVKVASFRTLVLWADESDRLDEGLYEGRETLPPEKVRISKRSRRGRIKEKGEPKAPIIHLARGTKTAGKKITIDCAIENAYIHPYQNVSIELDIPDGLSIDKVSPFKWKKAENRIEAGFVEAGMGVDPKETEFQIVFSVKKAAKSFPITGKVRYDDTATGRRRFADIKKTTVKG
jgi:hypothetical protein